MSRMKTPFPQLLEPKLIKTIVYIHVLKTKLKAENQRQKYYYHKHACQLRALQTGLAIRVWTDKRWNPARVTSILHEPRLYTIRTPSGQTYQLKGHHLVSMKENYHLASDLDNMDLPPMASDKDNRTFPLANEPMNHESETSKWTTS